VPVRLCGCGRVCVERDSVSVHDRRVTVEIDEYTLMIITPRPIQTARVRACTSIRIIDALGKKFIEHGSSFRDDELKRRYQDNPCIPLGIANED